MTLIVRGFVILFALWLATIAAGLVMSIGLLGTQVSGSVDPVDRFVFWGAAFVASGMTATLIFLPMLLAVVLTEVFALRSLLIHAAGGAAIMLLAYQGAGFGRYEESIDRAPPPISREAQIVAGAGVAFGLTYWLIAGRKAGRWKERA
jgi:hypothetical protein